MTRNRFRTASTGSCLLLIAALSVACQDGGDPSLDVVNRGTSAEESEPEAGGQASGEGAPPTVDRVGISPSVPVAGGVVRAMVTTSGEGPMRLEFSWQLGGRTFDDDSGVMEIPSLRKGEVVAVTVRAVNRAGVSEPVRHEVKVGNGPPQIVDLRLFERPDDGTGPAWVAEAIARDPDGDAVQIEYAWFVGDRQLSETGPTLSVDQLKRGDRVRVQVRATDGEDHSDVAESGIVEVQNTSPTIVSRPPRLDETGVFQYVVKVEDADGDRRFRFELEQGPRGMRVDLMSGEVTWTPSLDQAGIHPVEISVSDYNGGVATQSFRLPIAIRNAEDAVPAAPASMR